MSLTYEIFSPKLMGIFFKNWYTLWGKNITVKKFWIFSAQNIASFFLGVGYTFPQRTELGAMSTRGVFCTSWRKRRTTRGIIFPFGGPVSALSWWCISTRTVASTHERPVARGMSWKNWNLRKVNILKIGKH